MTDTVTREEFNRFKNATADMFEFVNRQHIDILKHVNAQHVALLSIVEKQHAEALSLAEKHYDIHHERLLALKEMFDGFAARVQSIFGERTTDEPKPPSVN